MNPNRQLPYWLEPADPHYRFPDPALAMSEPNGLLAVGGDLSVGRLLSAYRLGIFPWYSDGQPILWWTPDPRAVLFPNHLKVSRSLRKVLRRGDYRVTLDHAFDAVMAGCAAPRADDEGTWITAEIRHAYNRLHQHGFAHSVEAWQGEQLVGGLYGVSLGRVFFGESMFTRRSDASKVAFVHLVRYLQGRGYGVIDCQVSSRHLMSLGAQELPREVFQGLLRRYGESNSVPCSWYGELHLDQDLHTARLQRREPPGIEVGV